MEKINLEMEQRVWERVGGGTAAPDLRSMELRCRELAAVFRQLASQTRGGVREELAELARQEQAEADTLRGMRVLSGEEPEEPQNYGAVHVSLDRGLAQAVHRSREAWQAYSQNVRHPFYAPVFESLRSRESEHQCTILHIIGKTRKF